ncbi:MAG: KH domain-containing protein [Chloroflexi bacterium]|nr:MAG: KH domain-containing protein [Chloroflexota bacterium]TMG38568.1 MAG: KH domain-containing protein [Chloroflexota bacterium]
MYDYTDLVGYIIKSIVAKPDEVKVTMVEGERTNRVEVSLANEDVGKVIGRGGRNIDAIRAVVRAAALKNHDRVMVEIV